MILLNSYIAVGSIEQLGGIESMQKGTVREVAIGVTDVQVGDKVIYLRSDGDIIRAADKELIVIKSTKIIGKID